MALPWHRVATNSKDKESILKKQRKSEHQLSPKEKKKHHRVKKTPSKLAAFQERAPLSPTSNRQWDGIAVMDLATAGIRWCLLRTKSSLGHSGNRHSAKERLWMIRLYAWNHSIVSRPMWSGLCYGSKQLSISSPTRFNLPAHSSSTHNRCTAPPVIWQAAP